MRFLLCLIMFFYFFKIHSLIALIEREKFYNYAELIYNETKIPVISNNGKLIAYFNDSYDKIIIIDVEQSTENKLITHKEIDLAIKNDPTHDHFSSFSFACNDHYILLWRGLNYEKNYADQLFKINIHTSEISQISIKNEEITLCDYYASDSNHEEILILGERATTAYNKLNNTYNQMLVLKNTLEEKINQELQENNIETFLKIQTEINELSKNLGGILPELDALYNTKKNPPHEIYRVNLFNNVITKEIDFPYGHPTLFIDDTLNIQGALIVNNYNALNRFWLKNGQIWREIYNLNCNPLSKQKILNLSEDTQTLYFTEIKDNFRKVYALNTDFNEVTEIASDPNANIKKFIDFKQIKSFLKNNIIDLSMFENSYFYTTYALKPTIHTNNVLLQPIADLFNNLNLTSYEATIFAKNKLSFLLQGNIYTDAGCYYYCTLNIPEDNETLFKFLQQPEKLFSIKKLTLFPKKQEISNNSAPKIPKTFKSRDGLDLHCYITFPKNAVHNKPHPFVVDIHGGPHMRDKLSWEEHIQLWADRGIGTLQINFRGSTGFGKKFKEACFKELNGKMIDDIEDVVLCLIDEQIIDPSRLIIHGFSYGGTAVYNTLTRNSNIFKAGIAGAGDTDYALLIKHDPYSYWKNIILGEENASSDMIEETSKKQSPIYHAHHINVPLLIISPGNDQTVSYEHTNLIHNILETHDKNISVFKMLGEDHKNWKKENYLAGAALKEFFICDLFQLPYQEIDKDLYNAPDIKIMFSPEINDAQQTYIHTYISDDEEYHSEEYYSDDSADD